VNQVVPQLVSAALVGAFSPIATMATIAVLSAQCTPLANGAALLAGWTIVLVALSGLMIALLGGNGDALSDETKATLNLIIGVLLISFGVRQAIGARHPMAHIVEETPEHRQKPPRWMAALDRLTPVKAFGVGAVLLVASPADLAVYLSALQGLSGHTFSAGGRVIVLVLLIAAIDLCIVIPLAIYVALPHRARDVLTALRAWLVDHQRRVTAALLLVFGVVLSVSGTVDLA
jgi:hypothetical protein